MPIYEYSCNDCGTKFEKLVRGTAAEVACPACGESHVKQEHSTFAAHANGRPEPKMGGCGAGMCQMPGVCGRN